jgi:hypothetical protein
MRVLYRHITLAAPARALKTVWLSLALVGALSATTITYNPAPTTQAGWTNCGNYPGYSCLTTAYFDTTSLDAQNQEGNIATLFQDAWNAGNNGGLTLSISPDARNNGVAGDFDVTIAAAEQFVYGVGGPVVANANVQAGGAEINIDASNVVASLPALGPGDVVVWVQGLYVNYTVPAGTIVTPYYAMDTTVLSGLTCGGVTNRFCPPAYPYLYNDDHFYDQPLDAYMPPGATQAFFNADAYLGIMNRTNDTLTLYDGVAYGWENFVSPEPGAWVLFGSGFVAVLLVRRRLVNA